MCLTISIFEALILYVEIAESVKPYGLRLSEGLCSGQAGETPQAAVVRMSRTDSLVENFLPSIDGRNFEVQSKSSDSNA